jgi:hypothetical protein
MEGYAAAEAIRHRILAPQVHVQAQASSCEIHCSRRGTKASSSPSTFGFPVQVIISPLFPIYLLSPSAACDILIAPYPSPLCWGLHEWAGIWFVTDYGG